MEDIPSNIPTSIDDDAPIEEKTHFAAAQLGLGFVEHDRRNRAAAVDAFAAADNQQFNHLSESEARAAAEAYVEALWQKDAVEDSCRVDGEIDPDAVEKADWSSVEEAFRERTQLVGADEAYATLSTEGWRQHKAQGDYWTPLMEAQVHELRAAMQHETYPEKPRSGTSGFGPEAARYLTGVELHDMRRFDEAIAVMQPYFKRIFVAHEN